MNLIGLAAQKLNGKNVLGDIISKLIPNKKVKQIAFADEIKDSFCQLFDVTREFIEEWKENPEIPPGFSMTIRKALQFIGDGFKSVKSSVWIDQAFNRINSEHWWTIIHVITDARYLEEINKIKVEHGMTILLYRPGFLNNTNHPSEAQLVPILKWFMNKPEGYTTNFDFTNAPEGASLVDLYLLNDGTIEDLSQKVIKYIVPRLE
jgi:hypothetical protein